MKKKQFPLTKFLAYYIFGRDSVALSILEQNIEEICKPWDERTLNQEGKDLRTFWLIIGLIESGSLEKAEKIIRKFRPSDPILLFGIHLGSYLIQHYRIFTKDQKQIAENICNSLSERVQHFRVQLLNEIKTELLETREDKITAIDSPKSTEMI
ncbi:MAG: hypothetical protein ACRENF_04775 [Thermodesulfobacteriota bacterium]